MRKLKVRNKFFNNEVIATWDSRIRMWLVGPEGGRRDYVTDELLMQDYDFVEELHYDPVEDALG